MQHLRQCFILIIKSKDGMKACQIVSNLLCMLKHLSGIWDINLMHINIGNKTKLLLLRSIVCSDIFCLHSNLVYCGFKMYFNRFKITDETIQVEIRKSGRLNKTFFSKYW